MILVNGTARSEIPALDRGIAYGDGVFRTLPVHQGQPEQWQRHYVKLAHDCAALGLTCPDEALLRAEITTACRRHSERVIKIIVTRGSGPRGYGYGSDIQPTRIVFSGASPEYPASYAEAGIKARLCKLKLSHQPALAGIKHLNRLENVLARAEWSSSDIVEGILCDGDGYAIGGTMTNLFVVSHAGLVTPRLDRCGVAGVTRDRVMDAARLHGISCEVRNIEWAEVLHAEELLVVNSIAGAWPVRELDGKVHAPGSMTRSVQRWLAQESHAQVA